MKTPEEMAEEWARHWHKDCDYPEEILKHTIEATKTTFLAGYKAAKDEEATKDQKIAELWAESIKNMLPSVHEITLFPSKPSNDEVVAKMDAAIEKAKGNSLKNSNGWISVKDRLPRPGQEVLAFDNGIVRVKAISSHSTWHPYINGRRCNPSHWMELPEPPKEEK